MGMFTNPLSHAGYPPGVTGQPNNQPSEVRAATQAEANAGSLNYVYISPATLSGGSGSALGPRTQNGLLYGNGLTNPIGATAAGTTGQVATATSSAAPAFHDIGTGSSLTQYGVLLGGGAGAFTATGHGVAGQALISNGAAPPTYQTAILGPGSANSIMSLVDDFWPSNDAASTVGQLNWLAVGAASAAQQTGTAANPGQIVFTAGGASDGIVLSTSGPIGGIVLGGGVVTINFVIALTTLASAGNYIAYIGLGNGATAAVPTNGVYFKYTDNVAAGNWVGECTASSSTTASAASTTPAVTTFVNLGITINAAASSVSFTVNGASAGGAVTTNIPTAALFPIVTLTRVSGNVPAAAVDLMYMTYSLTTPR